MRQQKSLLLILLSIIGHISNGQKNEISLLNNRFFCTFPDSAKNIARPTDIMSADPNINNETRVMYDIGDKRIVFFVQELYMKSVNDLEEHLKEESTKEYPQAVKIIYNKDSILCITMTPSTFDDKRNAILINSLIVKNADNSLSKLSVYLNPKAFADKKTFDKITEQVFSSFRKGNRRLNLAARTETYNVLDTKTKMQVALPEDYIITIDKKYDFEVYKVRKVLPYGDTSHADLSIYYGFHPSSFNRAFQLENFKQADTNGEFMLQKMTWLNFKDDSRKLIVREQMFTDDDIQKNAQIHIGMISNNQKLIDELTRITQKILLKYDK